MANWLTRLFETEDKPSETLPVAAEGVGLIQNIDQATVKAPGSANVNIDIDVIFYRWLIGGQASAAAESSILEKIILDALEELGANSAGAKLVPRVPAIIPQLLKSLRDEQVSATALAHQIEHDVVLIAEVIREANSPYYHPARPVTNVENAVLLMGQNGLRLLIARVAFRPVINMQSGRFTNLAAPYIWEQSEKCADTCIRLAGEMKADPFEAFLAGLIQNVGLIVAFRLIDQLYDGKALPGSDNFLHALAAHARSLSATIGKQWNFPVSVIQAIEAGNKRFPNPAITPLHEILSTADRISKINLLIEHKLLTLS